MRVGFFKRFGSFFLDAMPIIFVLTLLFQFFVGDLLKQDGYDDYVAEYNVFIDEYNDKYDEYALQFENEEISETLFTNLVNNALTDFNWKTREQVSVIGMYTLILVPSYFILSFTIIYYAYNLLTKTKTLGRRILHIEVKGKITWWTIFIREVLWKCMFYSLTLIIGGLLIDIVSIGLSKNKKAARDYVTNTRIAHEGVDYPF